MGSGGLRGAFLGSYRFVLHGQSYWFKLVEGQRSGGGVWTWSLRSDRGGAEGSGCIHVRPLGGDSSRGGLPRRSRRGQALTALADSLRQVPGLAQAACDYLLTSLWEDAVAVQALPLQSAIGGRWLHRREDFAVRRCVLCSESPKGSWSTNAAGQSPKSSIADAHTAPGDDDLPPFPTGEGASKHPDRPLPVRNPRHATTNNGARNGGDSRQHPWRSVSSGLARSRWESVQAGVRRSRREEGGVQEVRAASGGLRWNSCWAGLPFVNAKRKHRRARWRCILLPTPHHARVFCRRSRSSKPHPQSKKEHFRPRQGAWRRWRLCTVLAFRKWPHVGRRVRALTERTGWHRRRCARSTGDNPALPPSSSVSCWVCQSPPSARKPKHCCDAEIHRSPAEENSSEFQWRGRCSGNSSDVWHSGCGRQHARLQLRRQRGCHLASKSPGVHSAGTSRHWRHEQLDWRLVWFSSSTWAEQGLTVEHSPASLWRRSAGASPSHETVHRSDELYLRISSADQRISSRNSRSSPSPSKSECRWAPLPNGRRRIRQAGGYPVWHGQPSSTPQPVQDEGEPGFAIEDTVVFGQLDWPYSRRRPHWRRWFSTSGLFTATAA